MDVCVQYGQQPKFFSKIYEFYFTLGSDLHALAPWTVTKTAYHGIKDILLFFLYNCYTKIRIL